MKSQISPGLMDGHTKLNKSMKAKKILLALFSILLITKGLSQTQVMNPYLPGTTCATCIVNNNSSPKGGGNNNTIMNGNGVIATNYVNTQCGLGYVHGRVKLGKRGSIAGVNQPAPITITGLPPCFQILKAYLYCGGSGNGIAINASVTNPATTNSIFPMTMIGAHVDKCWGYAGTRNYRADITALITGNGNYIVSGIPTNPPNVGNDMDGASIIIIYADPTQNWTGSIVIGDGCQVGIGGTQTNTLTGFVSCGASTFAQGFYIVSDMQNVGVYNMKMNSPVNNFIYPNGGQNWWDYCVGAASPVTAGQNSFPFGVSSAGDCYNIVVEGMYWRTTCNVCTVGNLTITPIVTSTCTIGSATAVVTGGNAPYSYTWTPSAATTSAINSVAPGSYTVTVKDASGCLTGTAVVLIPANVTTLAVNSSTICLGNTTTLTAVGGNSYTWTPISTLNTGNGPAVIASPTTTTIYTVTGTNSLGCVGSITSTVVVNPLPVIAVNNPTACLNTSFTLTSNGGSSYSWTGPNAYVSALQNPSFAVASPSLNGNYTVMVTSAQGCTQTAVANVSVVPLPTVSIVGTNTLCSHNYNGSPASVVITASGASSYTWNVPVGYVASSLNSPSFTLTPPNTNVQAVATLSVVGSNGSCSNSAVYTITVIPNPTISVTSMSICAGTSATLTATGATTYTWSPILTLNTANGSSVISTPSVTTIYSVIGSSLGCNSQTQNGTTSVVANPVVVITPTNPVICFGGSINLTAAGATTYTWSPNTALTTTNIATTVSNPTTTTTYSVLGSQSTCTNVGVITVTVLPLPVVNITLSSPTLCINGYNNSPNTISVTASGASVYNWVGFTGLNGSSNVGSFITVTSTGSPIGTGTVIGSNGTCTNLATFSVIAIPNPIIVVSSSTMCLNTSATLTAMGATSYIWSPNTNLNTTTGSSVIANPNSNMVYSVIGSSLGCNSQTQTGNVTVFPLPSMVISPPNPTICAGSSIGLTSAGATTYTWSPGSSLNTNTGNFVIASPVTTTNYTVVGTLNTCTASIIKQVIVIPLPTLQAFASATAICQGDKINMNANGASSYTWSPEFVNPNSNFITISPNVSTTYYLIGNNGLCTATLSIPIVVLSKPVLELSVNPQRICFGYSTTVNASGAQSYSWSPAPNTLNVGGNSAIVSPTTSTNYTVMGINYAGTVACMMTKEILVDIIPPIIPVVTNSVEICQGQSVKLNASGSNTYLWSPSDGLNNSQIYNPTANPRLTTLYTVYVSDGGYCRVASTVLVKVNPQPTVNAGPDITFNSDEPMYLNAKGTGTLTWIFGDGILCHDCPNSQVITRIGGNYVIQTVNQYGCKSTDDLNIEITNYYSIYIPNVFTPNFDGINDTFLVYGVGISNVEVSIFDRWGESLFNSKDQLKGWDGVYKGEICKQDVYTYVVNFTSLDGKKHTKTGHVTLLK